MSLVRESLFAFPGLWENPPTRRARSGLGTRSATPPRVAHSAMRSGPASPRCSAACPCGARPKRSGLPTENVGGRRALPRARWTDFPVMRVACWRSHWRWNQQPPGCSVPTSGYPSTTTKRGCWNCATLSSRSPVSSSPRCCCCERGEKMTTVPLVLSKPSDSPAIVTTGRIALALL